MKTLSEQICELCGIKPRYFIETNIGVFHQDNKEEAERIALKYNSVVLDVYPDFENNGTNFLKLFNLKYGQFTPDSPLTTHIFDSANEISDSTDYLFALIEFLKVEDGLQEHIKTVIRLTEWEY